MLSILCVKEVMRYVSWRFIFEWIQTVLILAGYVSGNATFPKPLNKSEEKKYLDLYAKGDESAKNVLIEHNLRLVAHIAKKYADEKNLEDLISIGTIGLIKGINTFNPEKIHVCLHIFHVVLRMKCLWLCVRQRNFKMKFPLMKVSAQTVRATI